MLTLPKKRYRDTAQKCGGCHVPCRTADWLPAWALLLPGWMALDRFLFPLSLGFLTYKVGIISPSFLGVFRDCVLTVKGVLEQSLAPDGPSIRLTIRVPVMRSLFIDCYWGWGFLCLSMSLHVEKEQGGIYLFCIPAALFGTMLSHGMPEFLLAEQVNDQMTNKKVGATNHLGVKKRT